MRYKLYSVFAAALASVAFSASATLSVGKVTLAIGGGQLTSGLGVVRQLSPGVDIFPGDRVVTGPGGHVHIRFLDGGLVSVRPHSNLQIEEYDYRVDQPSASNVRFQLDQGTARSISGAAAEAARQRFRLNTPLVAIGVRGTDFVVHSTKTQSTTTVSQGAVVVAAFGDGCSLQGIGPCSGAGSVLVTPETNGLLAEIGAGTSQTHLRHLGSTEVANIAAQRNRESSPSAQGNNAGRGGAAASTLALSAIGSSPQSDSLAQDPRTLLAALSLPPDLVGPKAPPEVLDTPPNSVAPPALAWGRWSEPAFLQDFSLAYATAREGREIAVANGTHGLYRSAGAFAPSSTGAVDLNLAHSYANYKSPSHQLSLAAVEDARLNINFGLRHFSTSLTVHSSVVGRQMVSGSGSIESDGIFRANGAEQNIAGAIGAGGSSAAYLFDKAVSGGVLSGITLWSK